MLRSRTTSPPPLAHADRAMDVLQYGMAILAFAVALILAAH